MTSLNDIRKTFFSRRNIVQLAIEAGIGPILTSVIGNAKSDVELLNLVHAQIVGSNPDLANALNVTILGKVIEAMQVYGDLSITKDIDIPSASPIPGPNGVFAGINGSDISLTWTAPPPGCTSEIYINGVFYMETDQGEVGGDGTADLVLQNVSAGAQTVRVLYKDENGAISKFGPVAVL